MGRGGGISSGGEVRLETLSVDVDGGAMRARLCVPARGPAPLLVMYCDALGHRPAMDTWAERWAEQGYAVAQPDLYRRSPPYAPFDYATVFGDPVERPRLFALMNGFTADQAMADTGALLEVLAAHPRIDASRIGVFGFCMGGRMAFFAASAFPDRVVAAASIHGGGLVTAAPNSPHLRVAECRARLWFHVAADDPACSPEAVATLRAALVDAGVAHAVAEEASARHGFAVDDAPVFEPEAARRSLEGLSTLFAETLS